MGIQVNLVRALERITLRTAQKRPVYGLFIDFSNAYNSVPHVLLFKKLREKKVLEEDEIAFLEQLYARYRIRLGGTELRVNKGVAQGSVISPALFNIFLEDLSDRIQVEAVVNMEDTLFYADDVLILCSSPHQLEKCIQVIEEWSTMNGMSLNKSKSGIVVFANRRATKVPKMKTEKRKVKGQGKRKRKEEKMETVWVPEQGSIKGIPICEEYKYLGTLLSPKLSCGPQIGRIKSKAAVLYSRLFPYLFHASADARRDIWQTMVAPLFNAALVLLHYEPSQCHKNNLERLRRCIFKEFMMISKRTNTTLVDEMIAKGLQELARSTVEVSLNRWVQRKNHEVVTANLRCLTQKNGLRGVPNNWCKLINTQVKPCPKCKKKGVVTTRWHLKYVHGEELPHVNAIWRKEIIPITHVTEETVYQNGRAREVKVAREDVKQQVEPVVAHHLENYLKVIAKILKEGDAHREIQEFKAEEGMDGLEVCLPSDGSLMN